MHTGDRRWYGIFLDQQIDASTGKFTRDPHDPTLGLVDYYQGCGQSFILINASGSMLWSAPEQLQQRREYQMMAEPLSVPCLRDKSA